MRNNDLSELLDELDIESWLDSQGVDYKTARGRSGTQLNVKVCPVCGNSDHKVYLNAETGLGNCLSGDTEILTREHGVVAIEKVAGQTVTLLDGKGNWVACPIVDHGIQTTYAAKFTSMSGSVIIRSTAEHGWIAPDGSIVHTSQLRRKKDRTSRVADLRWDRKVSDQDDHDRGVVHGLVYGDGSKEEFGNYRIRICSHHDSLTPYLSRFQSSIISTPDRDDPRFYIPKREAWCEFKQLPDAASCSLDYLLGFLRGWFSADGCVDEKGVCSICCGTDEADWLKRWSPVVGWRPRKHSALASETNFGPRKKDSGNLFFASVNMVDEDLLIEQHKQRWLDARKSAADHRWSFTDTKEGKTKPYDPQLQRVYCPSVPTTQSFALGCGVHSRNCFAGSHPPGETFNKWSFIRASLGAIPGAQVVDHIRVHLSSRGWKPKRSETRAVSAPAKLVLPTSYPLPYNGQNLAYLENRGIDSATAAYFHLRYCDEGFFPYDFEGKQQFQNHAKRVIIPVFDLDGMMVTFQGRDVTGVHPKKYLFPPGLPGTGQHLFNGMNVRDTKRIVIGEGAFDVMAIKLAFDQSADLRDVVAVGTFGKHLSGGGPESQEAKFQVLKDRGVEDVTIMWDGEIAATDSAIDAGTMLRKLGLRVRVAMLPRDKDPNEVAPSVVRDAFYKAVPLTMSSGVLIKMQRRKMNS